MEMKAMSSYYPPGMPASRRVEAEVHCPKCGKRWTITGYNELGGFFADADADWCCEDCGTEAVSD